MDALTFSFTRQDFLKQGEAVSSRCDELQSLLIRGCSLADIENPRGGQRVLLDRPVTNRLKGADKLRLENITQIQPQKLAITLRAGERRTPRQPTENQCFKNDENAHC